MGPGAQLVHCSQRRSRQYTYWGPGSFYPGVTRTSTDDLCLAPHCGEETEGKGCQSVVFQGC